MVDHCYTCYIYQIGVDRLLYRPHNRGMQQESAVDKKWYVFDQFDCLTHCETAAGAAVEADHFANSKEFWGVHIVQMTKPQFDHYCTHNNLAEALKVR